jgi:hypothetical protein
MGGHFPLDSCVALPQTRGENAATSFRLLDLPKELRLMVYERLSVTSSRHVIPLDKRGERMITLVNPSVPVRILATCRLVNHEAGLVLRPKVQQMLQTPPTMIIDVKDLVGLIPRKVSFMPYMTFFDKILMAIGSRSTQRAIHRVRKGKCPTRYLRTHLGYFEYLSDHALQAIGCFVLRAVTFKNADYSTPNHYPPIAIAVAMHEYFVRTPMTMTMTMTMSRAKRLYARYVQGRSWPQTVTARVSMNTLVAEFAASLSSMCSLWGTMSVCAMVHFPDPNEMYSNQLHLQSAFESGLDQGLQLARRQGYGDLVNYGGVHEYGEVSAGSDLSSATRLST